MKRREWAETLHTHLRAHEGHRLQRRRRREYFPAFQSKWVHISVTHTPVFLLVHAHTHTHFPPRHSNPSTETIQINTLLLSPLQSCMHFPLCADRGRLFCRKASRRYRRFVRSYSPGSHGGVTQIWSPLLNVHYSVFCLVFFLLKMCLINMADHIYKKESPPLMWPYVQMNAERRVDADDFFQAAVCSLSCLCLYMFVLPLHM